MTPPHDDLIAVFCLRDTRKYIPVAHPRHPCRGRSRKQNTATKPPHRVVIDSREWRTPVAAFPRDIERGMMPS
jgi:hypothetical protein